MKEGRRDGCKGIGWVYLIARRGEGEARQLHTTHGLLGLIFGLDRTLINKEFAVGDCSLNVLRVLRIRK
jgi:hypothetical protein